MRDAKRGVRERVRRGSAYLLVIMTTLIVAVIGLSAISLSRIELRRVTGMTDASAARNAARAGIEWGFEQIRDETVWSNLGTRNASWATNVTINGGTYSVSRTAYDNSDPVNPKMTLEAVGTYGNAVARCKVVIVRGAWVESGGWTQSVLTN